MIPREYIFDIEADGLYPSKIHCLSVGYKDGSGDFQIKTTSDCGEMRKFFTAPNTVFIGHNIIRWDIPNAERLLGIKVTGKLVDTLALSWYLYPERIKHGLESWGEDFGVPKPVITDWENLKLEDYIHRCEEDVKITESLYSKQKEDLIHLYGNYDKAWKLIEYLSFKMDCAKEQEISKWKLDVSRCESALEDLSLEKEGKVLRLQAAMPLVPVRSKLSKVKNKLKADGTLKAAAKRLEDIINSKKEIISEDESSVEYVSSYATPNPNSVSQIKDWLFSLGWDPKTYKTSQKGREVPQIKNDSTGELCDSVKELFSKERSLEQLEGVSVLSHRVGILKGFLRDQEDGYLKAEISGLTNTLRFKHSTIVNLPKKDAQYAEDIRACLITTEGYELCGSDMSSLEDRTKQHYMWKHDPEYVKEMLSDDFDPHLSLAVFAGGLTEDHSYKYKLDKKNRLPVDSEIDKIRHSYKTANYACVYGAGGVTIAKAANITKKEGSKLVKAYWEKNWAVKEIAKEQKTRVKLGKKWLLNPVNKLWYVVRSEKDIFSTLNQGTATYCFDMWVKEVRKIRPQLTGQFHDEIILCIKKGHREGCEKLLRDCITITNDKLKLNRELDIDVQFGKNYAEIH